MVLNDWSIKYHGEELVSPFKPERVQPASYDLALGTEFIQFRYPTNFPLDMLLVEEEGTKVARTHDEGLFLNPGEFVLGVTEESITLPNDIVARLEGKSSVGRMGVLIHVTAGFVDPGWSGPLTLEIYNLRKRPIILRPTLPICQISFQYLVAKAEKPYEGRYQNAEGVEASKYGKELV